MNTKQRNQRTGGSHRLPARLPLLAGGLLLAATVGCDNILEVQDPTVAAPGTIEIEEAVPTTLAAAVGAFQRAFSGSPGAGSFVDGQVTISAMLGDEFYVGDSFPTRIDVDQRQTDLQNATMQAAYARLHTARRLAEQSADLHTRFEGTTNTAGQAHALNLVGYSYILFGENYCSGVPFSAITGDGTIEFGEPLTTQQMFETAISYFDRALTAATAAGTGAGAVEQQNLARVGRARALLNLNQPGLAAQAAAEVPTGFVYQIFHTETTTGQQNGIWAANNSQRRVQPADREGDNGLPYRSANDPRVPFARGTGARANAFDAATPHFDQLKYPVRATNVVLASGVEARLIEAENQLRGGGTAWLNTLNALRATPPAYYPATVFPGIGTLTPLADPGTEAGRVDMLFRERAFWMWLTSHRLGDHRRLMRQYNRSDAGAGFPTGPYFKGGQYGDHVSILVPFDELNNPLFRDQFPAGCDPTVP
jgi:starch-binding outer membrane protein, SusD/RagB family